MGIAEARGEWIAFLDADDEWYPEHLEKMRELALRYPDETVLTSSRCQEAQGVVTWQFYSEDKKQESAVFSFRDYLELCLENRRPINSDSVCIKKSLAQRYQVFPEGKTTNSGDLYAWVILLARAGSFAWSGHLGAKSYRDIIGVSRTGVPSVELTYPRLEDEGF